MHNHNKTDSITRTKLAHEEQTCLVFAARDAHDRNTSAALIVVNTVLQNWDKLTQHTKEQLFRDARADATCNLDDWYRLYQKYESEKESS